MNGPRVNFFIVGLLAFVFIISPNISRAAFVYPEVKSQHVVSGDKFMVSIFLNTEGESINSVEGLVGVYSPEGPVYVHNLTVAGSDFSLWPNKPSLAFGKENSSINFVAGQPGGLIKDNALLFTLALATENPGDVYVIPVSLTGYKNDGKGTPVVVRDIELKITVNDVDRTLRDEWDEIVTSDDEPPLPFTIQMGQDDSVYEGKKFISFFTTDAQSGIDRYEVKEGDLDPVRSGTTYVLQNQTEQNISVTAYDKAGNVQTSIYTPELPSGKLFDIISIIGIIFASLIILFFVIRNEKNKNK